MHRLAPPMHRLAPPMHHLKPPMHHLKTCDAPQQKRNWVDSIGRFIDIKSIEIDEKIQWV